MYDSKKETLEHIENVWTLMKPVITTLMRRSINHDKSKLEAPEKEFFDLYTPKLKNSEYGSDEYKTFLKELEPALNHHYETNRHHPEHFENGINDMDLVDLMEMIADWKAASMRHETGDVLKSLELNQKRFGYSDELKSILTNTVRNYF